MPDPSGKLSDEEKKKAINWLNKRSGDAPLKCSVCQSSDWVLGDHLIAPAIFSGGLLLGGTAYPQAMIICKVCAHTVFFNAVIMGLLTIQPPATATDTDPESEKKAEGTHG